LAELTDSGKQSIMGGHELCKRAADWITKSAEDAEDMEKEELKQRLADMETQMAELIAGAAAPELRRPRRRQAEPKQTAQHDAKAA